MVKRAVVSDNRVNHSEIAEHDFPEREQRHDDHGRHDKRKRNFRHLFPAGRAVDGGRFVHAAVDAHDGGQKDDRVHPRAFPDAHQHKDCRPRARLRVPVDRVRSERLQSLVDKAVLRGKQAVKNISHDDPRKIVWKQHDRLADFNKPPVPQLVEAKRKQNGNDGARQNEKQIQINRIVGDEKGILRLEKKLEIFHSIPLTVKNDVEYAAVIVPEFLKRNQHIRIGAIAENKHVQNRRKRDQIGKPVLRDIAEKRAFPRFFLFDLHGKNPFIRRADRKCPEPSSKAWKRSRRKRRNTGARYSR